LPSSPAFYFDYDHVLAGRQAPQHGLDFVANIPHCRLPSCNVFAA